MGILEYSWTSSAQCLVECICSSISLMLISILMYAGICLPLKKNYFDHYVCRRSKVSPQSTSLSHIHCKNCSYPIGRWFYTFLCQISSYFSHFSPQVLFCPLSWSFCLPVILPSLPTDHIGRPFLALGFWRAVVALAVLWPPGRATTVCCYWLLSKSSLELHHSLYTYTTSGTGNLLHCKFYFWLFNLQDGLVVLKGSDQLQCRHFSILLMAI